MKKQRPEISPMKEGENYCSEMKSLRKRVNILDCSVKQELPGQHYSPFRPEQSVPSPETSDDDHAPSHTEHSAIELTNKLKDELRHLLSSEEFQ